MKPERVALFGLLVLAGLAAAHGTTDVALPFVWAFFTVCAVHPVFARLSRHTPRWVAALAVLLLLLLVIAALGAGLGYSAQAFASALEGRDWQSKRIDLWGYTLSFDDVRSWMSGKQREWVNQGLASATGMVLVLALSTLGIFETPLWRRWSERRRRGQSLQVLFARFGHDIRRYLLVRTALGLITGSVVTFGCWLLDIRLALVWGFSNFLLNYIPTIGSILGVIPPVAFTLADTGDPAAAVRALAIVGGAQLVLGNWVDPLFQGAYLKMSATAVLVSVTFWGWMWGPWGAFVGVPIMLFAARACHMSEVTKPLAALIVPSGDDEGSSRTFQGETGSD